MKFKKHKLLLTLCLFLSLGLSCNTTEPTSSKKITLEAEDASSTEAWLNLKLENISLPTEIKLKQYFGNLSNHDSTVIEANINSSDTTLFVENLLPNQTYSFNLTIEKLNNETIKSNKISVTTMDTTSHNFTWETFEIGDRGMLRDVAIINENNIWAVGEIYVNDSTGNSELYNVAHWDGSKWEILKIKYIYNGQGYMSPLNSIFSTNSNSIWVASNQPMHWNGDKWEQFDLPASIFNGWVNKIWFGTNDHVYIVGNDGNIATYNGSSWKKISSSTEVDLLDVWGTEDGSVVWACGYESDNSRTVLLRIEGGDIQKLYEGDSYGKNNDHYVGLFGGIYGKRDNLFLMSTGYFFKQRNSTTLNMKFISDITTWGYAIDGNDVNDIFISGQRGLVGHYNGYTYYEFDEFKNNQYFLYSLDVKNNITAIVGEQYLSPIEQNCIVIIGK